MAKNNKNSNGWLNNIGRMVKRKDGKGYFLVFERRKDKDKKPIGENPFPLTINEGDIFQLRAKREDLQRLVDEGKLSEETAQKICETVKFEINRAPVKEGTSLNRNDSDDEGDPEVDF